MDKVLELFQQYDSDGTGSLSHDQFAELLAETLNLDDESIQAIIQASDSDEDGEISYEEFLEWIFDDGGQDLLADADIIESAGEADEATSSSRSIDWNKKKDDLLEMKEGLPGGGEDDGLPDTDSGKVSTKGYDVTFASAQLAPWLAGMCQEPERTRLFQSISPNCLSQGMLGDCWYLAAIASLAEYPELITACFPDQDSPSPDGKYRVRIFDPTTWEEHVLDLTDSVPYYSSSGRACKPVFVSPTANEIFVLLLEKAAAKFGHKGLGGLKEGTDWMSISGGAMPYGWAMLTGVKESFQLKRKPGKSKWKCNLISKWENKSRFYIQNKGNFSHDQVWDRMVECDHNGAMMGCSLTGGHENVRDDGLVTGHAYSVVNVKECSVGKVVQCRNPWGNSKEWKGKLSDKSDFWESDDGKNVADELKYVPDADNGLFWMPFEEWSTRFEKLYITETRAKKRDFLYEFTEAFFKMVDRVKEGTFDGPTEKETKSLKYLWDDYSGKYGGSLDKMQLYDLLKMIGQPPADKEDDLDATYQEFDIDQDGAVGWDDFFGEMMVRVKNDFV